MNNFTLSFELISFLKWLLENKQENLINLIQDATKNGYIKSDPDIFINQDLAHEIINDFINFSEKKLKEELEIYDFLEVKLREQLTEISNFLNLSFFDSTAITNGFKQAKKQIQNFELPEGAYATNENLFKALLMAKILDNWDPSCSAAEA